MNSQDIAQPPAPGQPRSHSASSTKDAGRRILAALDVIVPHAGTSAGYTLALLFLVACVVLLPLVYLMLLTFLGWLAVWHGYQAYASLSYGPYIVFHLPMALLGVLLVTFLIKPVFFRKKFETSGVLTLQTDDEPLLFAAIEKLCTATGAKMPARIEVDCEPNAHARFLRPTDSLKGNGDLVLRIGLPLIAAFSVQQLAGVIGHELGHFNQRRGMTCSYLIRRLTSFFARIVFERDLIDQKLAALQTRRNLWVRLLHLITLALVEPMRGILWLMLLAGELLTCGVLRRMEYGADNVLAQLCGLEDFVQTMQSLLMLDIASRQARHDLAESSVTQRRLADDLPRLIVLNAKELTEHRADLLKLLERGKTHWFDSHPCHNDRTANAQQFSATALVGCPDPAISLFIRFESLCQWATKSLYEVILGESALEGIKLVPTQELADERAGYRANSKALARYFSGHVVAGRPIFPELLDPVSITSADALRKVIAARDAMQAQSDVLRPTIKQYTQSSGTLPAAKSQLTLCQIYRTNPRTKSIAAKMQKLVKQHGPWRTNAIAMLEDFESLGRQRLSCAIRLLASSAVAERLGSEIVPGKIAVTQMMSVCSSLEKCLPQIREIDDLIITLRVFLSAYNPKLPHQALVTQILTSTRAIVKSLKQIQSALNSTAFPFAHGNESGISLAEFVVPSLPNANDPNDTAMAAATTLHRYHDVSFRALSVLTLWGEKAEKAANLEPLVEIPWDAGESEATALSSKRTRKYWVGYSSRAVAGMVLITGLIYLSISPPTLPAMPWQSDEDRLNQFQPQAFTVAYRPAYQPPGFPASPQFGYQGHVFSMQSGRRQLIIPPSLNARYPVTPNTTLQQRMQPYLQYAPPPQTAFPSQPAIAPRPYAPQFQQPGVLQPLAPRGGSPSPGGGGRHR